MMSIMEKVFFVLPVAVLAIKLKEEGGAALGDLNFADAVVNLNFADAIIDNVTDSAEELGNIAGVIIDNAMDPLIDEDAIEQMLSVDIGDSDVDGGLVVGNSGSLSGNATINFRHETVNRNSDNGKSDVWLESDAGAGNSQLALMPDLLAGEDGDVYQIIADSLKLDNGARETMSFADNQRWNVSGGDHEKTTLTIGTGGYQGWGDELVADQPIMY